MKAFLTVLIVIFHFSGYCQTIVKAEKTAYQCINHTIGVKKKELKNLKKLYNFFKAKNEKNDQDFSSIDEKEIVEILLNSPLFIDNNLQEQLLINCLSNSYNQKDINIDTTSTYHQTLFLLQDLKKNSQKTRNQSSNSRIKKIEDVLSQEELKSELFQAIYVLLMLDIVKDSELLGESERNQPEYMELPSGEVEDEIEINITVPTDVPPCGDPDLIYTIVEKAPKFTGTSIKDYFQIRSEDVKGKVFIKFIIDCTGVPYDFQVVQSLSPKSDEMAMNLAKQMPAWTPGIQRGKRVKVTTVVPIIFD
ncbi:energy transducer TonB [Marinoscillum pacificum]|uniref:energy transducer TonB n=1 Tax=Marinoscillum pacificum TaxID=392723 RepID=UPI00215778C1|nr:energy transducer TonB [Marinoscillum pacificum]